MSTEANMFDTVDNAPPPGEGGVYFKPGQHIVRIERFFRHTNLMKVPGVIAEMTILHSSAPAAHPVGSAVSWIQRTNKQGWEGRVRKFGAEVMNADYANFKKAECEVASGPDNPFAGKVVMVDAFDTQTLKGAPITGVSFKRLPLDALTQWETYSKTVKAAVPMSSQD